MNINVLVRDDQEYMKPRSQDAIKFFKNTNPTLHPFSQAIEYKRAVNSAKVDRILAKPFIGDLTGHIDGVYCLVRSPEKLTSIISGACDGEIRLWNVATRKTVSNWVGHTGFVRGLTYAWKKEGVYSVGSDKRIHYWDISGAFSDGIEPKPITTWLGNDAFQAIDHQRKSTSFATVSANVLNLWDPKRSEPVQSLKWGDDTLNTVKINPIETYVLATTAEDRSIILYDIRGATPIKKIVMAMKSQCLAWNPMEAFNFSFGCEDHNAYTFDMRNLDVAKTVHSDHVSAILAIDYSPTGREFVTGSYDRTLRIYRSSEPKSRDIYYTKRMQRIFTLAYSGDSSYIFVGSDDTNIRIWKNNASQTIRFQRKTEIERQNYSKALIERYKDMPELRKILHRRVPKPIKTIQDTKLIMKKSKARKLENVKKHSAPGKVNEVHYKKKSIVRNVT